MYFNFGFAAWPDLGALPRLEVTSGLLLGYTAAVCLGVAAFLAIMLRRTDQPEPARRFNQFIMIPALSVSGLISLGGYLYNL